MCPVDQPIEDGVGKGGIGDRPVPLTEGELRADHGGAPLIYQASMEVSSSGIRQFYRCAGVYAVVDLKRVAGSLFAPLGYSYILAILMSLLVALTLTPALCHLLFEAKLSETLDPPLVRKG